jgi:hypothetical protein
LIVKQRLVMQAGRTSLPLRLLFSDFIEMYSPAHRKGWDTCMATSTVNPEFIEAVAAEMMSGIHAAVECWMAKIERALQSKTLTTLGRLQAVQEILTEYKRLADKAELECHGSPTAY